MPVEKVKSVLDAPDVTTRNQVIVTHLERMEDQLEQTNATVASLRAVLEAPRTQAPVEYRTVRPTAILAIRERVTMADLEAWWSGAFQELHKAIDDAGGVRTGPDGCCYPNEMFAEEEGEMVAFVPVQGHARVGGRVEAYELPGVELAVMLHQGSYHELDQTYGALGTYVAERAIGVEGPIRELYVVSPFEADDPADLRTELGWPVFRAG
jgi:effector-binding domain-containing protein